MTIYLAPTSNGLGSLISNLPAIDALVKNGQAPILVLRSQAQEAVAKLVNGIGGTVLESAFSAVKMAPGDQFVNLRDHPLQTDYIWGSDEFFATFPNTYFEDLFKTICLDKGIEISYDCLEPLQHRLCDAAVGKIILVPGSNGRQKCWPTSHFIELIQRLQALGHNCAVVGEPERSEFVKSLLDADVQWIKTTAFGDAVDAISSARAVVSVDTGLMHVAIHQGVSTVGLFRFANMILKERPHTRYLKAPRCAQACLDAQFAHVTNKKVKFDSSAGLSADQYYWLRWDCAEAEEKRCMAAISVDEVLAALLSLLNNANSVLKQQDE